ncbi:MULTISPECIES: YihY/virulence factor BrkB family protein [Halalkalicoccus]|uniref:YihY/virulence factor BrkB family protein n=1 Tax=Halalkalicoccus TaxID=332246 RepID=UPI002F963139
MNVRPERVKSIVLSIVEEIREQNVPFMAGSIAYQAFVSLIPLLALVFLAVAVVGDQSLANEVTDYTQSFLPPSAQDLLGGYIQGEAGSSTGGAGVIGAVTLIWGTLKIFRGLDTAFSEIYNSTAENSFVDQLTDGLVVIGTIAGAVLAAALATTAFAALQEIPFIGLLNPILLVFGLSVVFFPMYYLFPDVDLSPRQVVPGVIVAAVGWAVLQALFQVYLEYAGTGSASGSDVIGAILLLLTWLYLSGLILLLGAVVNAVLSGRGSADEQPETERAVDDLHDEARALERERERLDRMQTEPERDQRRRESERGSDDSDDDVETLRRANRALRRRLSWYEKPIWARAVWRLFGYGP